ncbi:hypothetical protein QE152_g30654 [Popillia japonica]|uniref:U3 small nucleolar RNA-associated protein 18 n=1 Tax=Popillia japonica TaxID=7064 RepID=A0AAW1JE08_POPJA
MPKHNRKRRHNKYESEIEIITPKNKFKILNERHGAEEAKLSELFGGASAFLQSLEEAEHEVGTSTANVDSGIGETDSDAEHKERSPVWLDEDDEVPVGTALDSQKRRLPNGGINSRSNEYKKLLKHKFEAIVGKPKWASLDKEDNSDSDDDILRTCGFITKRSKSHLPESTLEYKKVKDLNYHLYADGSQVNVIEYHPTSSVSLIAGSTGIATLFAVDGKENSKIHNIAFQRFPIYCAKFINNGNNILLGSRHNYIYDYDLMATSPTRITLPQNLTQCKNFIISPNEKYFAVIGRLGEIHILSTATKERLGLLRQDHDVTSLCFSSQGNLLYTHSTAGEVIIWDMNMRRAKYKWIDDGCIRGTAITTSNSNQFLATGSAEGVVNVYDIADLTVTKTPKPKKIVLNLTTAITDLKFNSSSELLALSSVEVDTSVRLLHLGSLTVFNNFPSFGTKLGRINVVNFSPGSGYLSLGNKKSAVALYRLKHYSSY